MNNIECFDTHIKIYIEKKKRTYTEGVILLL